MTLNDSDSQFDVDPQENKKRAGGPDDSRGSNDSDEETKPPHDPPRAGGPDDSRSE